MALDESDGFEHILDISMTPVLAFNSRDRSDVCKC